MFQIERERRAEAVRYLVYIRCPSDAATDKANLARNVTQALDRAFPKETQLAFSSASAETFAVFVKSNWFPRQILSMLGEARIGSHDATIWVLELGDQFAAIGNSRGWQWLQHH